MKALQSHFFQQIQNRDPVIYIIKITQELMLLCFVFHNKEHTYIYIYWTYIHIYFMYNWVKVLKGDRSYCILGIWKLSGIIHFYQSCLWLRFENIYVCVGSFGSWRALKQKGEKEGREGGGGGRRAKNKWEQWAENRIEMEQWANPQIKESLINSLRSMPDIRRVLKNAPPSEPLTLNDKHK